MTADPNNPNKSIDEAKLNLARLKDELRLKLHLAKKDAQEAWKSLEPAIGKLEKKLDDAAAIAKETGEKARVQATLGLNEVRASWPGLEKAVDQVVADVKKGAVDVKAEIDTLRVQAHLAEMDADGKVESIEAQLKKAGRQFTADLDEAAGEIKTSFQGLLKKLSSK